MKPLPLDDETLTEVQESVHSALGLVVVIVPNLSGLCKLVDGIHRVHLLQSSKKQIHVPFLTPWTWVVLHHLGMPDL